MTRMSGPNETVLPQREAEKRGVLQSHYLFGKPDPNHIDRLASCIVERSVGRGALIFAKDDPGSSLFAMCKGTAKMTVPSTDGHEVVVNLVTKGDIFGEIDLLDGRPRTTDAVAISDCKMFVIERRDFLPLVREEPEIALKLIEIVCGRLRQTTQQVESVMFLHLPGRLAKVLLRLSGGGGVACERKVASRRRILAALLACRGRAPTDNCAFGQRTDGFVLNAAKLPFCPWKPWKEFAESDSEGQ